MTKEPDQVIYRHGTEVCLTVRPDTGYAFTGWSRHLTGTANPASIIMNSDKTVMANYREPGIAKIGAWPAIRNRAGRETIFGVSVMAYDVVNPNVRLIVLGELLTYVIDYSDGTTDHHQEVLGRPMGGCHLQSYICHNRRKGQCLLLDSGSYCSDNRNGDWDIYTRTWTEGYADVDEGLNELP